MLHNTGLICALLTQQIEHAFCFSCTQTYKDPETAQCGHSLCKECWSEEKYCPVCKTCVPATPRRPNAPLRTLAANCQLLIDSYSKHTLHIEDEDVNSRTKNIKDDNCPMHNVKNWLQNSQNIFSNCASGSRPQVADLHFDIQAKDQQRKCNKNVSNPEIVVHKSQSQCDWDRIDVMPDTPIAHFTKRSHTDTELPLYTCDNPRRSTRKMGLEINKRTSQTSKDLSEGVETNGKNIQIKKNQNSVRKLRKEFNKINNVRKNKLNVSITHVKKTKSFTTSTVKDQSVVKKPREKSPITPCVIEEFDSIVSPQDQEFQHCAQSNICNNTNKENIIAAESKNNAVLNSRMERNVRNENANEKSDIEQRTSLTSKSKDNEPSCKLIDKSINTIENIITFHPLNKNDDDALKSNSFMSNKILFCKRGKLCIENCRECLPKTIKNTFDQSSYPEDININIKIGDRAINIVLKGKNDVQVNGKTYSSNVKQISDNINSSPEHHQVKDKGVVSKHVRQDFLIQSPSESIQIINQSQNRAPGEILNKRPENNLIQMELSDDDLLTTIVQHADGTPALNGGPEELDVLNTTSPDQAPVVGVRDTELSERSVPDKRALEIDAPIPLAKRLCLSDHSPQPIALESGSKECDRRSHSENLFSLTQGFCGLPTEGMPKPAIDIEPEAHKQNDVRAGEIGHDSCMEIDTDPSVVEASPCPMALPISNTAHPLESTKKPTRSCSVELVDPIPKVPCSNAANVREIESSLHTQKQCHGTQTCDTPLSITNFVDSIKHNSTPLARKSLKFGSLNATLCPTDTNNADKVDKDVITLENTIQPPSAPSVRTPCVAGSNLTSDELTKLKLLCAELGWTFSDNYTPKLTHLVVNVDDENRAQRTVKYMCALAAGKWVVSLAWAKRCAVAGGAVPEEPFEALDSTLSPGPHRSRIAVFRLFNGFTFHCMPPFSLLDIATLEGMLKASGANVVQSAAEARGDGPDPRLLLAESEQTQTPEDRFLFMAVKWCVVPVSVDWVLSCLGPYELCPLRDSLLCPSTLVEKFAYRWLPPLLDGPTDSQLDDDSVPPSP